MCDESTWHHKTFLVQSVYSHLAVKCYCIVLPSYLCLSILRERGGGVCVCGGGGGGGELDNFRRIVV